MAVDDGSGRGQDEAVSTAIASTRSDGDPGESAAEHHPIGNGLLDALAVVLPTAVALLATTYDISRSFGYDESVSVGLFVKAPSFTDAVTHQFVANNHQLNSAVSYLLHNLGLTSEAGLRTVPVLCLVLTTALLTWWCRRRIGPFATLVAGLTFATSPLVVMNARDLRGYAPLLLFATATTLAMLSAAERSRDRANARVLAYVILATLGTSAHLYMVLVLVAHTTYCAVQEPLRSARWWRWPALAGLIGLAIQLPLVTGITDAGGARAFRPTFPIDSAIALGGGGVLALATTVLAAGAGLATLWPRTSVRATAAVIAVMFLGTWIIGPQDLYPRFYVWLCPLIAVLVGLGARRLLRHGRSSAAVIVTLVALLVSSQSIHLVSDLNQEQPPTRHAAALLTAAQAAGAVPCVVKTSAEPLIGYLSPRQVSSALDAQGCDLVLSLAPTLDAPHLPSLEGMLDRRLGFGGSSALAAILSNGRFDCQWEAQEPKCWKVG